MSARARALRLLAGAAAVASVATMAAFIVTARRVEVVGESMEPTLLAGDRLLVLAKLALRPGDVVAVRDPGLGGRTWVKRVVSRSASELVVRGDNPGASTDSRHLGPMSLDEVVGKVVYRYHPPERAGRLPGAPWLPS